MTERAPEREVLRVLECAGPRGGIIYVHVLSCGCFKTFRKPVRKATCIACFVVQQGGEARPGRVELLAVIEKLQDLVGRAKHGYMNDRAVERWKNVVEPLDEAFALCVAARRHDP